MTRLCVSILVRSPPQARADIARAIEAGAETVELRIDLVDDPDSLKPVIAEFDIPFIFTCRGTAEGGRSELPPADRLLAAESLVRDSRDRIDLEFADFCSQPLDEHVIASAHDFQTRPPDLTKTFVAMQQSAAGVAKLAWAARTIRDNIEAFELMLAGPKPTIAICMGEAGRISRILAKKFNAFLSFAALDDSSSTAPGQVSIDELKRLYRWDKLARDTRVFGVVGNPVSHSMSPAIHNAGFDAIDFPGVYVPLPVNDGYESFKAFMESALAFSPLDLRGLSITIPHKEHALRYAREKHWIVDDRARRIGAVNTFVIDSPANARAFSSDHDAILDSVTAALSIDRSTLRSLRVAVIGAGGTGRTAVAAFALAGAGVEVFNRTRDRADALAAEFDNSPGRVVARPIDELRHTTADVIVNTTSLGMSPNVDSSPFDASPPTLKSHQLVFDCVYNPIDTKLLRQAREAGAKTISGVDMFVRQAAAQFEAWTNSPAPAGLFRDVVLTALRARA